MKTIKKYLSLIGSFISLVLLILVLFTENLKIINLRSFNGFELLFGKNIELNSLVIAVFTFSFPILLFVLFLLVSFVFYLLAFFKKNKHFQFYASVFLLLGFFNTFISYSFVLGNNYDELITLGYSSYQGGFAPVLVGILSLLFGAYSTVLSYEKEIVWAFLNFFKKIGIKIARFFVGIALGFVNFFVKKYEQFLEDDKDGRVSYLVMGWSSFKNKQYVNAVLYFLSEIIFIVFMIVYGFFALGMFFTLGDKVYNPGGQWDPELNDFAPAIPGDNSMTALLFGIIVLLFIFAFIYIYNRNLNTANHNNRLKYFVEYSHAYKEREVLLKKDSQFFLALDFDLNDKDAKKLYLQKRKEFILANNFDKLTNILISRVKFNILIDYDNYARKLLLHEIKFHEVFDKYNLFYNRKIVFSNAIKLVEKHEEILLLIKGEHQYCLTNDIGPDKLKDKREQVAIVSAYYHIHDTTANQVILNAQKGYSKAEIEGQYNEYLAKHLGEFDGRPKNFKESMATLLNENFSTTILFLPVAMAVIFVILPLLFTILVAFTNYGPGHIPTNELFDWVGLNNFFSFFKSNGASSQAKTIGTLLVWTIIWAFFATFLNYILGMLLAIIINRKTIKWKKFWRTMFVISIAVPQFVTLLIMNRILSDNGPINQTLIKYGYNMIPFLSDPFLAKVVVILVNCWVGVPYTMLITSGILMNIPADLYEAASIDGAGPTKQFLKITLPYMLFVTGPYLITQFIGNINNFNVIYFLTGGGPSNAALDHAGDTDLLITWLYKLTVNEQQYSMASTLGIFIFAACSIISLVLYARSGSANSEEAFS
ncbi:MAG: sugar ABC transporter permease [Bacillales bacterium]|jgi:arabinogalactan oligomer/maltooligosaccharide transport system permease protein|nr:sugar ABC transporter permease [Bacillales bacterium]